MLHLAEQFRHLLLPFVIGGIALLLALLALLVLQRLLRAGLESRRNGLLARYRPLVSEALAGDAPSRPDPARGVPRRHRQLIGQLLLASVRVVRGPEVARARAMAEQLGLLMRWRRDLDSSSWWRCAEAVLALGLLRDHESVAALSLLLDDDHEQIRAAAIDALGQIGDDAAIPALLARVGDHHHERTRVVEALRAFGSASTDALITFGQSRPSDRALAATVLGFVGGAAAREPLLAWTSDDAAAARAAAWTALGLVGVEDRAFYHALKAIRDPDPGVRAAVAGALAKSGRAEAAPHLADNLDAEWEVAVPSARALGRLGAEGARALQRRVAAGPGLGHDLAQQILWEGGHR